MFHHLRASRPLLLSVLTSPRLSPEEPMVEFVKEYYAYLSRITALSMASEVKPKEDVAAFAGLKPLTSHKSWGMLTGCAHELFELIPQICSLVQRRKTMFRRLSAKKKQSLAHAAFESRCEESDALEEEYTTLQSLISNWQPDMQAEPHFILCGGIFQQTLSLHLFTSFKSPSSHFSASENQFIEECFSIFLDLLESLPFSAPISTTLCWPLAVFGSLAREQSHQRIIHHRLMTMWEYSGAGHTRETAKFLESLWSSKDNILKDFWDLESLMKSHRIRIAFA